MIKIVIQEEKHYKELIYVRAFITDWIFVVYANFWLKTFINIKKT